MHDDKFIKEFANGLSRDDIIETLLAYLDHVGEMEGVYFLGLDDDLPAIKGLSQKQLKFLGLCRDEVIRRDHENK